MYDILKHKIPSQHTLQDRRDKYYNREEKVTSTPKKVSQIRDNKIPPLLLNPKSQLMLIQSNIPP